MVNNILIMQSKNIIKMYQILHLSWTLTWSRFKTILLHVKDMVSFNFRSNTSLKLIFWFKWFSNWLWYAILFLLDIDPIDLGGNEIENVVQDLYFARMMSIPSAHTMFAALGFGHKSWESQLHHVHHSCDSPMIRLWFAACCGWFN